MFHSLPQHIQHLLLFKIGAIGDVLLTTPLIRSLRQQFPDATIDYTTGEHSAPALANNPHLNNVISFEDEIIQQRNILKLLRLASDIRRRNYDAIFILDPSWQVHALAAFFGSVRVSVRRNHQRIHDSQHYLALGQQFGCETEDTKLELVRTAANERAAESFLKNLPRPRVAICPGGAKNPYQNMPARRWPPRHYAKLIRRLKSAGVGVVVLAGQKMSLAQTAAVMSQSDAVVTHDQGLMHVAATTGTPIVALFGPTDPRRKQPLGPQHRVIWQANEPCEHNGKLFQCGPEHDLKNITVDEVMVATSQSLPQSLRPW